MKNEEIEDEELTEKQKFKKALRKEAKEWRKEFAKEGKGLAKAFVSELDFWITGKQKKKKRRRK